MAKKSGGVEIQKMRIEPAVIPIIGETPVIVHRFSEKAARQMLSKQMGLATAGREKREPTLDFIRALYYTKDSHFGLPALAFKAASVRGGKAVGLVMTDMKGALHVKADVSGLVKLYGVPQLDFQAARNDNGSMDLRFRPRFDEWAVRLEIRYNANVLTLDQICQAVVSGGFGCGVGDWRPERDGIMGTYRIGTEAEVDEIRERAEEGRKHHFERFKAQIATVAREGTQLYELLQLDDSVPQEEIEALQNSFDGPKKVALPKGKKNGSPTDGTLLDDGAE